MDPKKTTTTDRREYSFQLARGGRGCPGGVGVDGPAQLGLARGGWVESGGTGGRAAADYMSTWPHNVIGLTSVYQDIGMQMGFAKHSSLKSCTLRTQHVNATN